MTKIFLWAISFLVLCLAVSPAFPEPPEANPERYYCPMHLDVVSDRPGDCPLCKMPLEKGAPPADSPLAVPSRAHSDHAPRHGGLLGMTDKHHPEYVYKPNGEHRVYLSDEFRHPLDTKDIKGTLTILYTNGSEEKFPLVASPGGTYLTADGKRKLPMGAAVRISLTSRGEDFFMDFVPPESMIHARPDPVGWRVWLTNAALALLSLGSLAFVFSRKGAKDPERPHVMRRGLLSAALVVTVSAGLLYVVNAMVLPRIEEAQEVAQSVPPRPPAPATTAAAAAGGKVRLDAQTQAVLGIKIEPVAETVLRKNVTALGRVTPRAGAVGEVFAPVAGRTITNGRVPSIGEVVQVGQSLVTVEQVLTVPEKTSLASEEYRIEANITQAQNTMNHAQLDYERAKRLYDLKATSQKDLHHAKLEYENAKAVYEGALKQREIYKASQPDNRNSIARYPVRAPVGGVVTFAETVNGEYVTTNKRLFTIMDLSAVWVQAQVYEKDLPDVLKNGKATFRFDALPDTTFEGRIKTVSPIVNEATRTVDIIFETPNPKMRLRVGMAARVFMETGQGHRSAAVPASAVLEDEGRMAVYVAVNDGEFVRREIQTGTTAQGLVEIKDGLKPGERVVTQGGYQIRSAALRAALKNGQYGDGHTGHVH